MYKPRLRFRVVIMLIVLFVSGCGTGPSSNQNTDNPDNAALKAYGLSGRAENTAATLNWPPINGALSYNLYWSNSTGISTLNANKIANVAPPYQHTGLSNNTAYQYVYTVVTAAGESAPSNEVKVTPEPSSEGAPTNVVALAGDGRRCRNCRWWN